VTSATRIHEDRKFGGYQTRFGNHKVHKVVLEPFWLLKAQKNAGAGQVSNHPLPNRIPPRRGNSIAYRSRAEDAAPLARHDEDKAQL